MRTAKGTVTRLTTRGYSLITSSDKLPELKALAAEFDSAYKQFLDAHEQHHHLLIEKRDIEGAPSYIREVKFIFTQYRDTVEFWVQDTEDRLKANTTPVVDSVCEHTTHVVNTPAQHESDTDESKDIPVTEKELEAVRSHYESNRQRMDLERDKLALKITLKREMPDSLNKN